MQTKNRLKRRKYMGKKRQEMLTKLSAYVALNIASVLQPVVNYH